MRKGIAIRNLVAICVAVAIGIFLCFGSFQVPFTVWNFKGFANSIQMGLDLKGGVMAVYNAEQSNESEGSFEDQLNATIARVEALISAKYPESTTVKQGTSQIRIEVPDVDNPDEVLSLIGEPALLEFKLYETDATAALTGKDVKNAEARFNSEKNEWGVSLAFTTQGATKFHKLTSDALAKEDKAIYIYIGGELFSAPTVNESIAGGETFISGSMPTQQDAESYATRILSGTYSVNLTLSEKNVVSATLGEDALLWSLIAGGISLILIMVFMWVVYKDLGLLAGLTLLIYQVLVFIALAVIPGIQLTLPGIAGIILGLGMAVDGNIIIFERIKDEFKKGKKIPSSVKSGFQRATVAILDSNITTIIASLVLFFLGTGSIRGFAITLMICVSLAMFSTVLLTRGLIKLYLHINNTNYKRLNFKKGVEINEQK